MNTGYQLVALVDTGPLSAVAGADGTAEVIFGPVKDGHVWNVFRIMVFSTSTTEGPAKIYLDDNSIETNFRAGTGAGIGDVDSNDRLIVPGTRSLMVAWSNMTPGASCSGVLQYEDLLMVTFPSDSTLLGSILTSGTN